MNLSIADIVTGLITAITTWISGRFLTLFRQRQLYLVIHKPMNFPYGDEQNYKVSAIILNKGRDKETNIKISFPYAQKINILASNYESIKSEGDKLLVDRILPGDEINLVISINSRYSYEENFLPSIISDDVNGKSYRELTKVPPSGSAFVAGGMVTVFLLCFMFLIPTITDKGKEVYTRYKYGDFIDKGFAFSKYTSTESIEGYSFKNNDMPVSLSSFSFEGGSAVYEFLIKNNKLENLIGSISFEPRNRDSYFDELGTIQDKYLNSGDGQYIKHAEELDKRYFRDKSDIKINIPPMQSKRLIIKRKVVDGMNYSDMKIRIELRLEGLKPYQSTTLIFDSKNNSTVDNVLKDIFK